MRLLSRLAMLAAALNLACGTEPDGSPANFDVNAEPSSAVELDSPIPPPGYFSVIDIDGPFAVLAAPPLGEAEPDWDRLWNQGSVGDRITLYDPSGELCTATLGSVAIVSKSADWVDMDGVDSAETPSPASRVFLGARIEPPYGGDCTGADWGAFDHASKPEVFVSQDPSEIPDAPAISDAAIDALRELPEYVEIQRLYEEAESEDGVRTASWWDQHPEAVSYIAFWGGSGRQFVGVGFDVGQGEAFGGAIWAVFERDGDVLRLRASERATAFPKAVFQIEPGQLEFSSASQWLSVSLAAITRLDTQVDECPRRTRSNQWAHCSEKLGEAVHVDDPEDDVLAISESGELELKLSDGGDLVLRRTSDGHEEILVDGDGSVCLQRPHIPGTCVTLRDFQSVEFHPDGQRAIFSIFPGRGEEILSVGLRTKKIHYIAWAFGYEHVLIRSGPHKGQFLLANHRTMTPTGFNAQPFRCMLVDGVSGRALRDVDDVAAGCTATPEVRALLGF